MPDHGYFLSCAEFTPPQLPEQARMAEQAGFTALAIGRVTMQQFFDCYRTRVLPSLQEAS